MTEAVLNNKCIHCKDKECHDGEFFCNYAMQKNSFYKNPRLYKGLKVIRSPTCKELEKENAELKEKLNIRSCQNCKHNNRSCPNDGSCKHYSKWEGYKSPQLTKVIAKLEKELNELTVTNERVLSDKNERISFLEIRNEELLNSVAELKKRNGELAGQKASLGRWLGEANAIIKKFSEFLDNKVEYDPEHPQEHTDLWNELCEQAERFLKEFTPPKV